MKLIAKIKSIFSHDGLHGNALVYVYSVPDKKQVRLSISSKDSSAFVYLNVEQSYELANAIIQAYNFKTNNK